MRYFYILLTLCFISSSWLCYADGESKFVLPKELTIEDNLKVSDIVHALLQQGNIRLDFEDIVLSSEHAITIASMLKNRDNRNQTSLSKREQYLLHRAETLKAGGADERTILDYIVPTLKASQLGSNLRGPNDVLERIAQLLPDYSLIKSNGSYILFSNKINYPKISKLFISNATPIEAYDILVQKVLKEAKLNMVSFDPLPYSDDADKRISLDLQDVDLRTALTRFSEALGNDVVWSISGLASHRMISFSRLRSN